MNYLLRVSLLLSLVVAQLPAQFFSGPAIQTVPAVVTLAAIQGLTNTAAILVSGGSTIPITVTASSSPTPWLTVTSAPATANGTSITISANAAGLQANMAYSGQVAITAPSVSDAPFTVPVTLDVLPPGACVVTLATSSANLTSAGTASAGGLLPEVPLTVGIAPVAGANCPGSYTVTSSASWLAATPGTNSFTYTALSNPLTLARGAALTIATSGGGSQTFAVMEAANTSEPLLDRQVRALYQTVLGRDPDSSGFAYWTGVYASGAALGQMVDDFLTSPEAFNSDFAVMATYQAATGGPPVYAQLTATVAAIRAGTQTIGGLFNSLTAGNPGYSATTLYENLLNRTPAQAEVSGYQAGPAAWFQMLIGFPSTSTPADAAENEFQSTGTFANLKSTVGDHTNPLYVTMLYFVILNRDPDSAGLQYWLGIANSGGAGILFQGAAGYPTRIQILGTGIPLVGFLGSLEFESLYQ
jgi:hypothetical protein